MAKPKSKPATPAHFEIRLPDGSIRGPFSIVLSKQEVERAFRDFPDAQFIEMRLVDPKELPHG